MCGTDLLAETIDSPVLTDHARSTPVFTVYFENDVFSNTDFHYSNGVKLSWLSADLVGWGQKGWRQCMVEALPFVNRCDGQKNFGLSLGQHMYTPTDNELYTPDPTDRPYAGWTYLEFAFVSKTRTVSDTISLQLGIVGPHSLAGKTQTTIHGWIGSAKAHGWEHQLHDEPGVNLIYERRWRMFARALSQRLGVDLIPHVGASLGNVQSYANGGGTVRVGFNLPSDFGVQLARAGSIGGTPTDDLDPRVSLKHNFSVFVFGAADGRAVARDLFLDGNTFRDSPSVDKESFVADFSYGVGLIAGRWQFTYTQVRRTREFKTQTGSPTEFGSCSVSCAF
ncbi:MAG: lipid A deacylase LpxR family protein [Opitutaceae bacterium]|nr:lipid A deacylase LpxR family protein [Opitutaceae bacterium]